MERRKGASAEREIVRLLRKHGITAARRTAPLQSAHAQALGIRGADVDGLPGLHLEVKRQERILIEAWCRQAEADAGENVPVVVWRRSRQPWRVTLPLDAFLELIAKEDG
jgi:Holliday junction resolvase